MEKTKHKNTKTKTLKKINIIWKKQNTKTQNL